MWVNRGSLGTSSVLAYVDLYLTGQPVLHYNDVYIGSAMDHPLQEKRR